MNLLIDLGNSRIKWTFVSSGRWRPAEAATLSIALLDRVWSQASAPARVVGVSVAATERRVEVDAWVQRRWGRTPVWIEAQARLLGVSNGYHRPAQLGADRWAALIAAHAAVPGAVCVVDCGTAVTIDALAADGEFRGGVILPGLRLARHSLAHGTAAIAEEKGDPRFCLARTTADGVAAGTLFGVVGAIERVLAEQRRALNGAAEIIMTGGDAEVLAPHLSLPLRIDPDLIVKGVALIAEATR